LYECNPLAFVIEQAGGKATTGDKRIMEVQINELHQRTPLVIGSSEMVDKVVEFMAKYKEQKV
jgi:fructose-1,6-bisphosphatase I